MGATSVPLTFYQHLFFVHWYTLLKYLNTVTQYWKIHTFLNPKPGKGLAHCFLCSWIKRYQVKLFPTYSNKLFTFIFNLLKKRNCFLLMENLSFVCKKLDVCVSQLRSGIHVAQSLCSNLKCCIFPIHLATSS